MVLIWISCVDYDWSCHVMLWDCEMSKARWQHSGSGCDFFFTRKVTHAQCLLKTIAHTTLELKLLKSMFGTTCDDWPNNEAVNLKILIIYYFQNIWSYTPYPKGSINGTAQATQILFPGLLGFVQILLLGTVSLYSHSKIYVCTLAGSRK